MSWMIVEWLAAFLGVSGAFIMATNVLSHRLAWIVWIISNILLISLFTFHTNQLGLLFMQGTGLVINSLGYWQWSNGKNSNLFLCKIFYRGSWILGVSAIFMMAAFIMSPSCTKVEWIGACFGTGAALLLSSNHRFC
jgi:nicotinamide riboside transporter PnuC